MRIHDENVRFPEPDRVRMDGRLSARFQGNLKYLATIFENKKDWMLEPFQSRGQEWVIEPRRNKKGELPWAGEYAGKWLDAACLAAASSKDKRLSQYTAAFAAALTATQEADGYLGIEIPALRVAIQRGTCGISSMSWQGCLLILKSMVRRHRLKRL